MKVTRVTTDGAGDVRLVPDQTPGFVPFDHWEGEPLDGVELHEIETRGEIELQLVRIAAGGRFVQHASPKLAFCHVVHGAGRLTLPDGRAVAYEGPETFVFHPHAVHGWDEITDDTLLAVAIVPDGEDDDRG